MQTEEEAGSEVCACGSGAARGLPLAHAQTFVGATVSLHRAGVGGLRPTSGAPAFTAHWGVGVGLVVGLCLWPPGEARGPGWPGSS